MGIFDWLRGKKDEIDIDLDSEEFREKHRETLNDISADIAFDKKEDDDRIRRKKRTKHFPSIRYIKPHESDWRVIHNKTLFRKEIKGEPYDFIALHIDQYDQPCFTCLGCGNKYRGLHFRAIKPVIRGFFCVFCFRQIPNYQEPLTDSQKKIVEDALSRSRDLGK